MSTTIPPTNSNNVFINLLSTPSSGGILGNNKGFIFPIVSNLNPANNVSIASLCNQIDVCLNATDLNQNMVYFMDGGSLYFSYPYSATPKYSSLISKPSTIPTNLINSLKNPTPGVNTIGQYWISSDNLFFLYRNSAPIASSTPPTPSGYYIFYNVVESPSFSNISYLAETPLIPLYCKTIQNIDSKFCGAFTTTPGIAPTTTSPGSVTTPPTTTLGSVTTTPTITLGNTTTNTPTSVVTNMPTTIPLIVTAAPSIILSNKNMIIGGVAVIVLLLLLIMLKHKT